MTQHDVDLHVLASYQHIHNLHNQQSILLFHSSLTVLYSLHRDVGITLTWSPVDRSRVSDSTVRLKAHQACRLTPLASLNRVQSAAYQKYMARKKTFAKWAQEWHTRNRSFGVDRPFAYQNALIFPPDGKNQPLWSAAQKDVWVDDSGKLSRHTTSTALRLAVGHAFVSDDTRRLRPDIPESDNACE